MEKKLLFIGPLPPPAGGVSVHISRLAGLMKPYFRVGFVDESKVRKRDVFNFRSFNPFGYFGNILQSNIVHIHTGGRWLRYFHVISSKLLFRKTVLTIHSYKKKESGMIAKLDSWVYSLPNLTIIVTDDFNSRLRLHNRVLVKEAFLPPLTESEPELPHELVNWVKSKKADGYAVAAANAWRLNRHKGEDLYGLDLCIEAAKNIRDAGKKIAFVFVVSDLDGDIDIGIYERLISEQGLQEVFYLQKKQVSFVNLVAASDVVLRPTNTDGDALTIREALFFGKNVIASDVVQRPAGTILFRTRDSADLTTRLIETVANGSENGNNDKSDRAQSDLVNFYKDIYTNLN